MTRVSGGASRFREAAWCGISTSIIATAALFVAALPGGGLHGPLAEDPSSIIPGLVVGLAAAAIAGASVPTVRRLAGAKSLLSFALTGAGLGVCLFLFFFIPALIRAPGCCRPWPKPAVWLAVIALGGLYGLAMKAVLAFVRRPRPSWLVGILIAATVGPVGVGELAHYAEFGHFAVGLHADAVMSRENDGAVYSHDLFSIRLVNLTPMPMTARLCSWPTDTTEEVFLFRYDIERRSGSGEWLPVLEVHARDCAPAWLARTVLWPGMPSIAVESLTAADLEGTQVGDHLRFRVFRDFSGNGRRPFGTTSSEVVMDENAAAAVGITP